MLDSSWRPRPLRHWRAPLRAGLLSIAASLAGAAAVAELDPVRGDGGRAAAFGLPPVLGIALGVVLLLRSLPTLARGGRLRRAAELLQHRLGDEYAVLASYAPRESPDVAIDLVAIGPTGIFSIEVCELATDVSCYDDVWYRRHGSAAWRFRESPTQAARWKATRLKADVATAGFVRTSVEPLVFFPRARIVEVDGTSVGAVDGFDDLAKHLRGWNRSPLSDNRARAIVRTLSGTFGVAS